MKKYQNLFRKIEKIEKLLNEVKAELKKTDIESSDKKKKLNTKKKTWNNESLGEDFDNLYKEFLENNSVVVNEFINKKGLLYLKDFCKANNITLDSKNTTKDKIATQIIQWFMQRKAISKRIQQ